ncbi:MAG: glutamine-hydrolyzing carbamoyl-phosphate synthase small subunit [bacterium]|nr:glutamine-hydrolyzing carbamoyl-phosphate synthase small subunit [bacterium]
MRELRPAILALEDGRVFRGRAFGAWADAEGELVFNTAMTGYQEILTDPSYRGQMVVMTYPHIGNYGVIPGDEESRRVWTEAFIVKEICRRPSHHRAVGDVDGYLKKFGVPGIEGIDTRALTRHIREAGALKAVLSSTTLDADILIERAKLSPGLEGRDLVQDVTCAKAYRMGESGKPLCVAYDLGAKREIFEQLAERFFLEIVPAGESAEDVLLREPDAVFLSNGPGDPAALGHIVENVKKLLGKVPLVGICLGHQILAQALGARTFKLKFGHHGANHPVQHRITRKVAITSQNHSYAVDPKSFQKGTITTHLNLNDQTCEGLMCAEPPVFSVQYHPEACPGPHDARELFDRFYAFCRGEE